MQYTLNCNGRLLSLEEPRVMGILNVTPDSFYAQSRVQTERDIVQRARQIVDEGGSIIDIGACSTRPDSEPVSQQEEMERLRLALGAVRKEMPDAIISVDTFRADVARMAVEEYGADIINDVGTTSPSPSQGGEQSNSPSGRSRENSQITLEGTTNEYVTLDITDLLYIEAVGNYVKVCQVRDNDVHTTMLRATMKQMEDVLQAFPMIVRCHRAFMVNLGQVEQISTNSRAMQLAMRHCHEAIPVSRSNVHTLKELLG